MKPAMETHKKTQRRDSFRFFGSALAVFVLAAAVPNSIFPQTSAEKGHVALSIGSLRASYSIFASESEVSSPLMQVGIPLGVTGRFRAWSVPYFFNPRSMDIQVMVRAPLALSPNLSLSPLAGLEVGLRNSHDIRAAANLQTWFAPTAGAMLTARFGWFEGRLQIESLLYANGMNVRAIPELGVCFNRFAILARTEFTGLFTYDGSNREFHGETFLAFRMDF